MMSATLAAIVAALVVMPSRPAQGPRPYDDMWPAWSPDGRRIVFVSTRDGDPEIYVMNADGTDPRRLTATPGRDAHPYFSPDGARIVFQSPREEGHTRIFVMNADGSNQRALTRNQGFCGVPTWSPDGRLIAFQCTEDLARTSTDRPWKLFVVSADGGAPRQLTHGASNDQVPNWSPDGQRLVFYSDRSGIDQLYTIDPAGGPAVPLTTTGGPNRAASWSRDGRSVVFHSERQGRPSDIYRLIVVGGEPVRLTTSGPQHGVPYFAPDGRTIAFQCRSGESWRICLMNPDGTNQRPIGGGERAADARELILVSYSAENAVGLVSPDDRTIVATFGVAKAPHEIAVSRDGRRAYVATTGGGPEAPARGPANVVTMLNLATRRTEAHLDIGTFERPHDVRVSGDGATIWIACAPAQTVLELDAAAGRVRREWKTNADGGWFLEVTPDGHKIYVPHLEGKRVTVIDRERGTVSAVLDGGAQSGIAMSPDGRSVWVIDHEQRRINVIETAADRVAATVGLGSASFGRLRFAPDGRSVVVVQDRTMTVIDAASRTTAWSIELPFDAKVVDVSRRGDRAVVSHPADDRITIVDLTARRILATMPTGKTPDGVAWVR
jgi:TolB protein